MNRKRQNATMLLGIRMWSWVWTVVFFEKWNIKAVEKIQTVVHYLDKTGTKRYKGTSHLRKTENLVLNQLQIILFEKWSEEGAFHFECPFLIDLFLNSPWNILRSRHPVLPRQYPMPFARAVTDMIEKMKMAAKGCPQLPPHVPTALQNPDWNWNGMKVMSGNFAGLDDLYQYLRNAAALKIPQDWKPHFPRKL